MNLQTKLNLESQRFNQIDYNSKLLLIGSCFSEHIGQKFDYFKFQHLQNPLGILFHPLAIEKLITNAINEKSYSKDELVFHNDQFHCFDTHSRLSNVSESQLLEDINRTTQQTLEFLKSASHVTITLGTAWAYRHIERDSFVANCHKIPQNKFLKELLSIEQISESLDAIVKLVRSINPNVVFIFTVSPVRHLKDGFVENARSKAHLIAGIHQVVDARKHINYFPSYELMMDELRDYRFYDKDMLHPSALAIQYIWECFSQVWIAPESTSTMNDIDTIQKGLAHRPFNPNSEAHQQFLDNLKTKQSLITSMFPHIQF